MRTGGGNAEPIEAEAVGPEWLYGLEPWSAPAVHATTLALALMVGHVDSRVDSPAISLFYLLPVLLTSWRLGRRAGIAWALAAAGLSLAAALVSGSPAGAAAWGNAALHLAVLLPVALAVATIRPVVDLAGSPADTDHLTGLFHAGSFQELVELERSRSLRYNRPFTLAYLDVDRFRQVNDRRGHAIGDRTLQLIGRTIRENIRSMDSVARLGGDEFGILLPETGRGSAEIALSKIQSCLAAAAEEHRLPITFSIGAVICVGAPGSVDRIIHRADVLMYRVKDAGGDGMVVEVLDDQFGIEAILQRS